MWTPAARAELVRETLPYATCLSDAEWAVLAPLLPAAARTGRPWLWSQRAVLDGILYVLRTGCAWRYLPLDFPPWGTVHRWFLRWAEAGVFERLAHALTLADRERVGRQAGPKGPSWMRKPRARAASGSRACAATIPPSASSAASAMR